MTTETRHEFTCADCRQHIVHVNPQGFGGTGYATINENGKDKKVCYACVAKRDRLALQTEDRIDLYLVKRDDQWFVTNWPSTLEIKVSAPRIGDHNIAGKGSRADVWFTVSSENKINYWHGVNIGDNQILRCKRVAKF